MYNHCIWPNKIPNQKAVLKTSWVTFFKSLPNRILNSTLFWRLVVQFIQQTKTWNYIREGLFQRKECGIRCVILELFLRMTPLHQEYCSPHKYKMFCEKIFKIGVLKLCGNGFLHSLLCRQRCTVVHTRAV